MEFNLFDVFPLTLKTFEDLNLVRYFLFKLKDQTNVPFGVR